MANSSSTSVYPALGLGLRAARPPAAGRRVSPDGPVPARRADGDERLQLHEVLLADATHVHEFLGFLEPAVLLRVLDDAVGRRLADARQRIELRGRRGIEVDGSARRRGLAAAAWAPRLVADRPRASRTIARSGSWCASRPHRAGARCARGNVRTIPTVNGRAATCLIVPCACPPARALTIVARSRRRNVTGGAHAARGVRMRDRAEPPGRVSPRQGRHRRTRQFAVPPTVAIASGCPVRLPLTGNGSSGDVNWRCRRTRGRSSNPSLAARLAANDARRRREP